jgi:hypothetical protein
MCGDPLRWIGAHPGRRSANGKKATAAVTRCGCGRVGFFGGYETRRGECGDSSGSASAVSGEREHETRRTPGSAAGCNTSATPVRREPSRWCETTRTEPASRWLREAEAGGDTGRCGRRAGACRWRGVLTNPKRGGWFTSQAKQVLRRGREGHEGANGRVTGRARLPPELQVDPVTGQHPEGAGKTNDPQRSVSSDCARVDHQ